MVKIFVGNLPPQAESEEIKSLFAQYGTVTECAIIKNFAFVHMDDRKNATKAIRSLHLYKLHGTPINVEASHGKNQGPIKLHVANVEKGVEDELRALFEEYGTVTECSIIKNFAFVHMNNSDEAMDAIKGLDNTDFQGKRIHVQVSKSRPRGEEEGYGPPESGGYWPPRFPGEHPQPGPPGFGRGRFGPPGTPTVKGCLRHHLRAIHTKVNLCTCVPKPCSARARYRKCCSDFLSTPFRDLFIWRLLSHWCLRNSRSAVKMVKIFVGNLSSSATKEDLRSLFSQYGKVAECDVLRNFGFVHMDTQKEAEEAVRKLHHHELNGQAINVEMSRGKPKGTTKLHVGNISSSCTNQELREKFAEFGSVVECDIVKDYAFVHMERREDAMEAISALDNATFQGKVINVQLSTSRLRTVPGMGDITGCYVCGEPGHWSKACRRGQNGSYGGGGGGGGSPMGGIRATSGFPRAGPAYSSGVPAAFPSRSYSATLPPIPTVSYTPSYGISRDYTAETRYLSKPTAVYTERSITYERDPSRYAAEYYEKFRAQPLGSSYLEDRRISIPPPPPLSSSSLSRMRLAPSSLDPYDRRALPPPSSAASAYFSRDRSPIRRVGAGSEGYSYERSRLSPVSRSSSYSVSHSRDTPTDRARYNY